MSNEESSSCEFSKEFKKHLDELTKQWKGILKRSKKILLKCPNFEKCEYKCGSIGGMQYHYPRCAGACPVFRCNKCGKEYESRTGLNYHNSSHHTGSPPSYADGVSRSRVRPKEYVPNDTVSLNESFPPPPPPSSLPTKKKKKGKKSVHESQASPKTPSSEGSESIKEDRPVTPPTNTPITVPSIEYPEKYRPFLPVWRDELKAKQVVTCPNHKCQYECSTVNGMKYHYVRCQKEKLPEFECSLCAKSFHCRSGLVWHLKNSHKVDDHLLTNQSASSKSNSVNKATVVSKRGRRKVASKNVNPPKVSKQKSSRKSDSPRRAAMSILNKSYESSAWIGPLVAPPKLHSPPVRTRITPTEFNITEPIPTDNVSYGSLTVGYPLEILTEWHKWYSDSDSSTSDEEEENEEDKGIGKEGRTSAAITKIDSDFSSSTSEDDPSDEDYRGSSMPSSRGRGGRGRGRPRGTKGRGKGKDILSSQPPPLKSDVTKLTAKPIPPSSVNSKVSTTANAPIPKLISAKPKPSNINHKQKLISPDVGQKVLLKTQGPGNYVQYLQVPVQSLPPNLVPVQLISNATTNIQLPTGSGGLLLLQQSGSQSLTRTPQRVSVIMNPRPINNSTSNITQLDGPRGKGKGKRGSLTRQQLDEKFEKTRQSITSPTASKSRKRKKEIEDSQGDVQEDEEDNAVKRQKIDENSTTPSSKRKDTSIMCPHCSTSFPSQTKLKTHIATTHLSFSPEATVAERAPVWRQVIKKYKYICCESCLTYRAKSVAIMKYHFERCGKNVTLSCSECGKEYTTKGGLEYHVKAIHTAQEEHLVMVTPEPLTIDTIGLHRAAALEATNKLKKIVTSNEEEIKEVVVMETSSTEAEEIPQASTEVEEIPQIKQLRLLFKNEQSVVCPKGCGQSYKSFLGLKYHLENGHMMKKKYKCPYCKRILSSKKLIASHLEKKHDKIVESTSDLEYAASLSNEEDENEEEDEEEATKKKSKKKSAKENVGSKRSTFFGGRSYPQSMKMIQEKLHSKSVLYPQWKPLVNDFKLLEESELDMYLPLHKDSMICEFKKHETSLPLFHKSEDNLIFTGGPVQSMAWHPTDVSYVVMSCHKTFNETPDTDYALVHKGLIQIWKLGKFDQNKKCVPDPVFGFGIAHNWGCIRDMKWCPSATQDTLTQADDNTCMSRLGLLATACSDGQARILSIPYPEVISQSLCSSSSFSHTITTLSRVPAILKSGQCDDSVHGQCLCVEWLPSTPHAKITAGFSSGMIAVWSIDKSVSFLKSWDSALKAAVYFPLIHLLAHSGPVRCLAWCSRDTNFLFSGGTDKMCCLWDLRQPQSPIQKTERAGVVVQAVWPTLWPSIFIIEDTPKLVSIQHLSFSTHGPPTSLTVTRCPTPVSCFNYSAEGDRILMGTYSGEVSCLNITSSLYCNTYRHKPLSKRNVLTAKLDRIDKSEEVEESFTYGTDSESDIMSQYKVLFQPGINISESTCEPDGIPFTAVTSCAIKELDQHHIWYLCAFNNGFVQLITKP